MTAYTKYGGQITVIPTSSGRELHLVKDRARPDKIIAQIYGERDGLHGTIALDLSDFREGLLMAGIGTRRRAEEA